MCMNEIITIPTEQMKQCTVRENTFASTSADTQSNVCTQREGRERQLKSIIVRREMTCVRWSLRSSLSPRKVRTRGGEVFQCILFSYYYIVYTRVSSLSVSHCMDVLPQANRMFAHLSLSLCEPLVPR